MAVVAFEEQFQLRAIATCRQKAPVMCAPVNSRMLFQTLCCSTTFLQVSNVYGHVTTPQQTLALLDVFPAQNNIVYAVSLLLKSLYTDEGNPGESLYCLSIHLLYIKYK